ncbi:hypothetical protein [Sediminicurvatus halobius]|uniref:Uncharacterized protein n=1 Tax=Sediminicurvatus halobius TaxID=2182432 RepID=A0A2U2MYL6_9GAMM|nr:hypothetical protein [Spiribacter halobius]PWG61908.1 hypothetical protein DEM34_14375 [Spiribacter halobius]UEX79216.1 hypothetical protein LMH63_06145 [Spiribacter halobius]
MEASQSRSAPVIAVLPFAAGEEDARLARALAEVLTGELARFGGLEVIAPASAAAVAELPEAEAAARLDADYLLRGRLVGGARPELAVTLAARDARMVWHEAIAMPDEAPADALAELAARVAATFSAQLSGDAARRARRRGPGTRADFERVAHALSLLKTGTREADEAARAIFGEILARDPQNPAALGGMALSWFNEWSCDFWSDFEEIGRRAYDYAHRALAIDDRDPWLHLIVGRILIYRREFERGAFYIDRALALCPSDAELLIQIVPPLVYLGRAEEAARLTGKAMRLNPYHPNYYFAYAAFPPFVMRDFAGAVALAERATDVMIIDIPAFSAVACRHLGQVEKAQGYLRLFESEFRRKITPGREPEPGEPLDWLLAYNPFRREEDAALVREGFALLGVPSEPMRPKTATETGRMTRMPEGDWEITFAERTVRLPNLKGLHDLSRLLSRPGDEFYCLDLTGRGDASPGESVLDARGREAIKLRVRELQEELAEAEDMNDIGRAEQLRDEMDRLIESLSNALGLGGRDRRLGDLAERARSAVTWRIRHAIRRIEKAHPTLGRHLSNSVRTGLFSCYRPERRVTWRIADGRSAAAGG